MNAIELRKKQIERAADAMEQRRRKLIAQPLARIWGELADAAVTAAREVELEEHYHRMRRYADSDDGCSL